MKFVIASMQINNNKDFSNNQNPIFNQGSLFFKEFFQSFSQFI